MNYLTFNSMPNKERVASLKNLNPKWFLVDCPGVAWTNPVPKEDCTGNKKKKERKEDNMYNEFLDDMETPLDDKTAYLNSRIRDIAYAKDKELGKTFNLYDDPVPSTVKDLVDRILAGKFILPEQRADQLDYNPVRWITWRDPSVKKDEAGYRAAVEKLEAAKTATEDLVNVLSDEQARLKALQDFESTTFH